MSSVIKKFWESKIGKIIHYTIHESNNANTIIKLSTQLLESYHEKNELTPEIISNHIMVVLTAVNRNIESLDYLYIKSKKQWEDDIITDSKLIKNEYINDINWHKNNLPNDDYIEWLENKLITNSQK